jgi:hypothetical protein
MLANKRLGKVGRYLRVLTERLVGGEREWQRELGAAVAMAAVQLGVAHGGTGRSFYSWSGASVGDEG